MHNYEGLKNGIKSQLGIDLHSYKEQQMRRRINQWLDRHSLKSYNQLLDVLRSDEEHRAKFLQYLTINTSNFFRDSSVFTNIEKQVLPAISTHNRPKIWSAGASFGAEIYSIAMLLAEYNYFPQLLLATDIDEAMLEQGRNGIFQPSQLTGLTQKYLEKHFTDLGDGRMAISEELKRRIVFQQHDLLKDPYQTGFDLILCRNVFIYFTSETQKRLTARFVQSLKPGGYFIVGSAEQIVDPASFQLDRVSYCIYQKKL